MTDAPSWAPVIGIAVAWAALVLAIVLTVYLTDPKGD
jgi:hypothetical protein